MPSPVQVIALSGPKRNRKQPIDIAHEPGPDWSGPDARQRARQAVARMLAEMGVGEASEEGTEAAQEGGEQNRVEVSPLQVARLLTPEAFRVRHLNQMLRVLYQNQPYFAVADCRPDLASWRHQLVPDDYWRGLEGIERAKVATTRMLAAFGLAELAQRRPLLAATHVTRSVFSWCGLDQVLDIVYAGSTDAALRAVLPGIPPRRLERSPKGYWQGPEGTERAQEATRTLIGEYGWGGLSAEEVALRISRKMFLQHGLAGMLDAVYDRRAYDALADIYPGLHQWQMGTAPHGYWTGPERRARGRTATRWLIRRLGLRGAPLAEIARRLNKATFEASGLGGMLSGVYHSSPYAALQDVYPDLRPWLVDTQAPNGYWAGHQGRQHAREAMHWMISELGLQKAAPAGVAQVVDQSLFVSKGLGGMLGIVYGNSPYAALADVYPALRPWQMRGGVPMRYWQGEEGRQHAQEATRWLLEQFGLTNEDPAELADVIEEGMFIDQGLYGMLSIVYGGSSYGALSDIYPQLPPREPKTYMPKGYWQGEEGRARARAATRQMLTSLDLDGAEPDEIAAVVDKGVFLERGLGNLLRTVYGSSAYAALADLFPDLRPWQMGGHTPQGCWQGEEGRRNGPEATRHMLARLGMLDGVIDTEPAGIARVVDANVFEREGLGVMLREVYSGSPYEALKDVLPELRPWQMARTPRGYWSGEAGRAHAREATLWLLDKLDFEARPGNKELQALTKATFEDHGLVGMLAAVYGNSPHDALADAIPGLRPWQVRSVPRDYWRGEEGRARARVATRWLLAERGIEVGTLDGTTDGTPENTADPTAITDAVDRAAFVQAGLGGMLAGVYGGSAHAALADVVPGLLPWQTGKQVPLNYWQGEESREHAREAIRWMLVQLSQQDASPAAIAESVTQEVFDRYGLQGMLKTVYASSRYAALSDVLPDLRPWQMGVRVPQGYWRGPEARDRARTALRWLLDQAGLHGLDPVHIAKGFNKELFKRHGLSGMLQEVYGGSLFGSVRI